MVSIDGGDSGAVKSDSVTPDSAAPGRRRGPDVDWAHLDKQKFFVWGTGECCVVGRCGLSPPLSPPPLTHSSRPPLAVSFSSVTLALYPLTVIKTRQMALRHEGGAGRGGLSGAWSVGRALYADCGVRGLYKGFGTVVFGTIPARVVYLSVLERTRAATHDLLASPSNRGDGSTVADALPGGAAGAAGAASFAAGFAASLATQTITVPVDVVSQRLMVQGGRGRGGASGGGVGVTGAGPAAGTAAAAGAARAAARAGQASPAGAPPGTSSSLSPSSSLPAAGPQRYRSGLHAAATIVREQGVRGLYRGLPLSLVTYAPSNALWWSGYGTFQRLLWDALGRHASDDDDRTPGGAAVVGVQACSGVLAGITSGFITTPLDVVRTRLQTHDRDTHASGGSSSTLRGPRPTAAGVVRDLVGREGPRGLWRGAAPRMASSALWGTAMVSVFEALKRACELPGGAEDDKTADRARADSP